VPIDTDDVTVPAPLPGYALAIFVPLSSLPFGLCALLWIGASSVALLTSIELLRRVIALPAATIFIAIFLPVTIVAIPLGQLAPFVGCAIAACAYGLKFGRWRLAGAAALATGVDPAIALALCATLVLAVPATRATILGGTVALAAVALLTLGLDTNVEYIRGVLHAHAAASVAERSQFSTTHFAWVVGLGSKAALVIGNLWYASAAAVGIWIAIRLRLRIGTAALALVPPAFAVFGGLYVHFSQLILALPAFLMVAQHFAGKQRWMSAAIFMLAVPWLALAAFPPFAIALVASGVAYAGNRDQSKIGLRLGLSSAALLIVFFAVALAVIRVPTSAFHTVVGADALAELSWSRYVAWRDPKPDLLYLMLQLPTVFAFSACLVSVFRTGMRRERRCLSVA
jgi:hypothetical protein